MSGRIWTKAEDALLTKLYPHHNNTFITKKLNRSFPSIYNRAYLLGLKRSPAYLASHDCGRMIKGGGRGKEFQFKPGQVPVNKGKKMADYLPPETIEKIAKTQFRKGDIPKNHRPVGSERTSVDGYIEIKVAESNRWMAKHRAVWTEAHGPIPKGMIVSFKDRNKQNFNIENLELLNRLQNLQRNSVHSLPKEIALAVQMVGALKRQINKRK